ncbi:hypothetical protein, partial [Arthrobacter sp. Y81]|uniref:hypothetical protein n=1 Tax=Arthrobacter sp. Y81 TaxID=2058897 RepID=UPI001CA5806F
MLVEVSLAHVLGGVVVADHWPAFPLLQSIKCGLSAHSLPSQLPTNVPRDRSTFLAWEARGALEDPLCFGSSV